MNNIINCFFDKSFENEINQNLMEYDYSFPTGKMIEYVDELISLPIEKYLDYITKNTSFSFDVTDIFQFSKLEDAIYNLPILMINNGDKGFSYIEMGKLLENDGKTRGNGAFRKYGENHAKAGKLLGYLYSYKYTYYVSCLGYILTKLSKEKRDLLFERLFIRTNIFRMIYILTSDNTLDFRKFLDNIKDSTYKRRATNIKTMLEKAQSVGDYDYTSIISKIIF